MNADGGRDTPGQRINRAAEMIRVFQAAHHRPGLSVRTLPDPTPEAVADLLNLVFVELLAGSEVTPGSHRPGCWALPGHHRCAIEALNAAEDPDVVALLRVLATDAIAVARRLDSDTLALAPKGYDRRDPDVVALEGRMAAIEAASNRNARTAP